MLPHQLVAMHTLRYSITTRSLQSGADFRVVHGLLGTVDASTRMMYGYAMWAAFRAVGAIRRAAGDGRPTRLATLITRNTTGPKPRFFIA